MKIILFLIFFTLIFCQELNAQSEQSLIGVSPAILEEVLIPGTAKKLKINVFNLTDSPLPIKSFVKSFFPKEEVPAEFQPIFNSTSNIKIEPAEFILKPKEKKELFIKIKTPKDSEPGGHYSTIFFQPLISQELINSQNLNQAPQVGVHTLLITTGKLIEKLNINHLKVPRFSQLGPSEFEIEIKNSGNVHEIPNGDLVVSSIFNRPIDIVKLPITTILPKTTKALKLYPSKNYTIGVYKIQFIGFYGSTREKLNSSPVYIWVIPWFYLIIFMLLTLIVIYLTIKRDKLTLAIKVLFKKDV